MCLLVEGVMNTQGKTTRPQTQPQPLSLKVMELQQRPPSSLKGTQTGQGCARREPWTRTQKAL